jgi:hypothetical protein
VLRRALRYLYDQGITATDLLIRPK